MPNSFAALAGKSILDIFPVKSSEAKENSASEISKVKGLGVWVAACTKPGSAEASPMPATARVLCWMNWRLVDMGEVVYL
jgi:hypothetical protein